MELEFRTQNISSFVGSTLVVTKPILGKQKNNWVSQRKMTFSSIFFKDKGKK